MPQQTADDDEWDDDESDWQPDDEESFDDDLGEEDESTIACPQCQRPIHEDAQQCPYCQHYLSDEEAPSSPIPWWIVIATVLCLISLVLGLVL